MTDITDQTKQTTPSKKMHPMPFCRVEIAVMGLVDGRLSVLLALREQSPYQFRLALVGGVLRIDLDQSLDDAAHRTLRERCALEIPLLRQLCAEGGPTRDPRSPWALSVVYRALIKVENFSPVAGKRVQDLVWYPVDEIADDENIAFDHAKLIGQAVSVTRAEIKAFDLSAGILPEKFTLRELQSGCDQIFGEKRDKVTFRRKLAEKDIVELVPGEMRLGPYRPAHVYQFKQSTAGKELLKS